MYIFAIIDLVYSVYREYSLSIIAIVDSLYTGSVEYSVYIVFIADNIHIADTVTVVYTVASVNAVYTYTMAIVATGYTVAIVAIVFSAYNLYTQYIVHSVLSDMLPVTLVGFTTMGRKDGIILFLGGQGYGILALHLQPLVEFVIEQDPTLAGLRSWHLALLQLHVEGVQGHTEIVSRFLHVHRATHTFQLLLGLAFLKVKQYHLHADDFIPKLGNDPRKVVECQSFLYHT